MNRILRIYLYFIGHVCGYLLKLSNTFFASMKVEGLENLASVNGRVIIIINHASMLDPFTMVSGLPMKVLHKILPIRFATHHRFYDNPFLKPALYSWGCFPVYPKSGDLSQVLRKAVEITNKNDGNSIVVFPEGRIVKPGETRPARPGVAYLARESGWMILPVYLGGTYKSSLFKYFTFRKKYLVKYGKPFYYKDIADKDTDLREAAARMMEKIYCLNKNN